MNTRTTVPGIKTCSDIVGNKHGDNLLRIDEFTYSPLLMNGQNGLGGTGYREATNLPSTRSDQPITHLSTVGVFKDATTTIAALHPGQPAVELPTFLYELKDLPDMISHAKSRANTLHHFWKNRGRPRLTHRFLSNYYSKRRAGEDYLNYIFGWRPFFSDIADMVLVHDYLEKRQKLYSSIRGGEIRRSAGLGSNQITQEVAVGFWSDGFSVSGRERTTTVRDRWVSSCWKVDPIRYGATLSGSSRQLLKDCLGLDYALPIQIWNAMPFSWMIDWAVNVGSIITLLGNRQGVRFHSACVMDQRTTQVDMFCTVKPSWMTVQNGVRKRVSKHRDVFSPSFLKDDLGLDILGPGQLATLSALAVTRGRGSSRF